jgi:hypothetical protein
VGAAALGQCQQHRGANDAHCTDAVEAQIAAQGKKVRAMMEPIEADANAHIKDELTTEVDKLKALNMPKMQDSYSDRDRDREGRETRPSCRGSMD